MRASESNAKEQVTIFARSVKNNKKGKYMVLLITLTKIKENLSTVILL